MLWVFVKMLRYTICFCMCDNFRAVRWPDIVTPVSKTAELLGWLASDSESGKPKESRWLELGAAF